VVVDDVMTTVADAVMAVERVVADQGRIPSRAQPNPSPQLRSQSLSKLPKQQPWQTRTPLLNNQQEMTRQPRTAQQRPD
jgi:hypothetical protein